MNENHEDVMLVVREEVKIWNRLPLDSVYRLLCLVSGRQQLLLCFEVVFLGLCNGCTVFAQDVMSRKVTILGS
ncbi:hypothetical protein ARMSODRAFT_104708 [Armillaria solidipes]|uniref:Uncharacterized protein n=1 Tax=Armillaria solidipes TaxID=1076256 RepID=A0A2H3B474_9AGAR|nr:hypothetical protein ARMSODRAFT_104708 [Armillaria solidipes]